MARLVRSDWAMRFAIVIALVLLIVVLIIGIRTAGDTQASRKLAEGQVTQQDRSDCVRDLTQDQNNVVRRRDNLGWRGLLDEAQGNDADLRVLVPQLKAAISAVNNLPPLPDLVSEKCPAVPSGDASP